MDKSKNRGLISSVNVVCDGTFGACLLEAVRVFLDGSGGEG